MRNTLPSFEYVEAHTIEEALRLADSPGARFLAGGTDLIVAMRTKGIRPQVVINLKTIRGLDYIDDRQDGLHIGCLVTMNRISESQEILSRYGCLAEAAGLVGSYQVRHRATIGGNLCNGAPSAETAPPLLALNARVIIEESNSRREIDLQQFFLSPGKTVCTNSGSALLREIVIPRSDNNLRTIYIKHSPRKAMDIAVVGVAVALSLDGTARIREVRIALGAVAPTPIRAYTAESALVGRKLTASLAREAGRLAAGDAKPISDVRASAEYRREMVEVLVARALMTLLERWGGDAYEH